VKTGFADVMVRGVWARRLAVGFFLWSITWIMVSDFVVGILARDRAGFWTLQTEKGLIYVLVSAVILWYAIRSFESDQERIRAANEQRLRLLKDSGLIGVAGIGTDGRFTDANWVFRDMLGHSMHSLLRMKSEDVIAPGFEEERRQAQSEFSQHGRTRLFRCDLTSKLGDRVPVIAGRALIGDSGESIAYFLDVSPLMRSEERRLKLQEQLLQSEKMGALGQFASGVAHNFNNELSIIVGYGAVLEEQLAGDLTASRQLQQVLDSAERSRKLIQQLLAFSRKQPIHPEVVDVNVVLTDLQPSIRRLLDDSVDLRIEAAVQPEWVRVDPSQLVQVLLNLVANARDAMPNGGTLVMAVHDRRHNGRSAVTIEVTDNGVGMDDATAQHIFEPFFTTKLGTGGTGLGLATAYGAVQQNGGDIEVISRPGIGTTFHLIFPKHETVSTPATEPSAAPTSTGMTGNVLLVEDRDDVRELMSQILTSNGIQVTSARDGVEAIEMANAFPIDLILSDVVMPRMSGPEAVRIIRESHPDIKVIYVSGSADLVEPNGRDVVMWKPVKPQALLTAIKSCLTPETTSFKSCAA
jgi:PAS domain S-box-containing protein